MFAAALPWLIPLAISGISAAAGAFGGRKQKAESTSTSDTVANRIDSSQNWNDSMTQPMYDPFQLAMRDYLLNQFQNRANSSTDMRGYVGQGLSNINAASDLREQGLQAMLSQRGLSRTGMAGNALSQLQGGRIGESINFLNQVPLVQRQMQMEDLSQFANFFKGLPVGQRNFGTTWSQGQSQTTGQEKRTGTQENPGNVMGGLLSGLGAGLAMWPRNPQTGQYQFPGFAKPDMGNT